MRFSFILLLFGLLATAPVSAAFVAEAPAAPAAQEFPTRTAVEAELGRKMKFTERVLYGVAKRKYRRQVRRAERRGEQRADGPVASLAIVSGSLALASLLALFLGPVGGILYFLLGLAALITGIIALVQFGGKNNYMRGRGLAIAGVAAPFGFLLLLILIALIAVGVSV